MTATEVVIALRRHYGDAWALVEQVANGTGWNAAECGHRIVRQNHLAVGQRVFCGRCALAEPKP